LVDNFCKIYQEWEEHKLLPNDKKRQRERNLNFCELLTIVLYFYLSPCHDFKNCYLYYLRYKYKGYFALFGYSRIIQLWPRIVLPLVIMMQLLEGAETGIYFIDSTKLSSCHNKRTSNNKVFGRIDKIGMSSYGWFMGFKLHLVTNHKGGIIAIKITKGNSSYRELILLLRDCKVNYFEIKVIYRKIYSLSFMLGTYVYSLVFVKICKTICLN